MAYSEEASITITTDGSQAGSAYTPVINGRLDSVMVDSDDLTANFSLVASSERDGETIFSITDASGKYRPTLPVHGSDGAADEAAKTSVLLSNDRILFSVASGGASKACTIKVKVEGSFSGA